MRRIHNPRGIKGMEGKAAGGHDVTFKGWISSAASTLKYAETRLDASWGFSGAPS